VLHQILCSTFDDLDVVQSQLPFDSCQERDALSLRFDQPKREIGSNDLQRQPRNPSARANINQPKWTLPQTSQEQQGILEQLPRDGLCRPMSCEPLNAIPPHQEIEILTELMALFGGRGPAHQDVNRATETT
jgi:hypothetical protein